MTTMITPFANDMSRLEGTWRPATTSESPARPRALAEEIPTPTRHHQVVVIGGGAAGLAVLQRLADMLSGADVMLIEPSEYRYDQPGWMRVGAGEAAKESTRHPEASALPGGVTWIRDRVAAIDPDAQTITTASGERVGYDYLVIAVGVEVRWDGVHGLAEHLGRDGICSVYGYEEAEQAWQMIRAFMRGRALFTAPSGPFKGGGAPLKILHRAEAIWR